jgi:hypothetical protein
MVGVASVTDCVPVAVDPHWLQLCQAPQQLVHLLFTNGLSVSLVFDTLNLLSAFLLH